MAACTRSSVGGASTAMLFSGARLTVVRTATRSAWSSAALSTAITRGRSTTLDTALATCVAGSATATGARSSRRSLSVSEPSRGGDARSPRSAATAVRLAPPRDIHFAPSMNASAPTGSDACSASASVTSAGRRVRSLTKGSGLRSPTSTRWR